MSRKCVIICLTVNYKDYEEDNEVYERTESNLKSKFRRNLHYQILDILENEKAWAVIKYIEKLKL